MQKFYIKQDIERLRHPKQKNNYAVKIGAKVSQLCCAEIYSCIGLSDSEIRATPLRKKIQYFLFAITQKNWNF